MCVCICVCVCAYMCVCVCVCAYTFVCVCVVQGSLWHVSCVCYNILLSQLIRRVCVCLCMCANTRAHACTCTLMCNWLKSVTRVGGGAGVGNLTHLSLSLSLRAPLLTSPPSSTFSHRNDRKRDFLTIAFIALPTAVDVWLLLPLYFAALLLPAAAAAAASLVSLARLGE